MPKYLRKTERSFIAGSASDDELLYITNIDPDLEQWRALGAEWIATRRTAKAGGMEVLKLFLYDYLHLLQLEKNPAKFLRSGYLAPCFYESTLKRFGTQQRIRRCHTLVCQFLKYVLGRVHAI
jgi:hypothetical protein